MVAIGDDGGRVVPQEYAQTRICYVSKSSTFANCSGVGVLDL